MSYFKNWTPKENNYITELIIKVPVYFNHMHFVIFTETIAQIMLGVMVGGGGRCWSFHLTGL